MYETIYDVGLRRDDGRTGKRKENPKTRDDSRSNKADYSGLLEKQKLCPKEGIAVHRKSTNISLFRKTRDPIEQLYGGEITRNFPRYAEFWIEFIGDPKKAGPTAYGLLFNRTIPEEDKKRMNEIYEEVCMAHYSLFCHLAGAHFHIENLKESLPINDQKSYFEYWDSFEDCYFHLGSAFYQTYHLWGLIFLLKGEMKRNKKGRIFGAKSKLKKYLEKRGKIAFSSRIDDLDEGIKNLRDNIVHYARTASRPILGIPCIPREIKQETWKKQHESGEWMDTLIKVQSDLKKTENLINNIHIFLIEEFRNYLMKSKIKIDR